MNNNDEPSKKKQKKTVLPAAPWSLSSANLSIADQRALGITTPRNCSEYHTCTFFTKPWQVGTMDTKLKLVTENLLAWCIRGFLGEEQEKSLFTFFKTIKDMCRVDLTRTDIPLLQEQVSSALALIERDFPVKLQDITMHLLHHIPEGLKKYGPLRLRWAFPYERTLCWVALQSLNKAKQESTIMETYAVYDFCSFLVASGQIMELPKKDSHVQLFDLRDKIAKIEGTDETVEIKGKRQILSGVYIEQLAKHYGVDKCDVNPFVEIQKRFTKRHELLEDTQYVGGENNFVFTTPEIYEKAKATHCKLEDIHLGRFCRTVRHVHRSNEEVFGLIDVFSDVREHNKMFLSALTAAPTRRLVPIAQGRVMAPSQPGTVAVARWFGLHHSTSLQIQKLHLIVMASHGPRRAEELTLGY